MNIQMVDLKSQYEKIKEEVDAGIQDVIDNTQFIKGPQIKQFEEALAAELGVRHVIACANGTDALQVAMMALGLQRGDEVILPVFTYAATAEVVALLGLVPVMVDVDPDTFCIDVHLIEAKISVRTKAIVPVHLFGQCADMEGILRIANKHNLFVIEDTAQAIGAVYRGKSEEVRIKSDQKTLHSSLLPLHFDDTLAGMPAVALAKAGTIGTIGTTSFFPSKNLGCFGDGGALMTNDDELAARVRMICSHGQSVQYVHDVIGVNSRLDTIQAAVLLAKLPHLRNYELARNEAANLYDRLLGNQPNIIIPKRNKNSTHVFHQYTLKIVGKNRDEVRKRLADKGIPSMVYYPIELHKQKAFAAYHKNGDSYPVSEMLCSSVLSLPMHTEMSKEMVEYICNSLIAILNQEG
jgi:dTDP-4-amino-4,6-dideoxygalactose transaminase